MNIKSILLSYCLTFIVFLSIDIFWLGVVAKKLYRRYLGKFLSEDINWKAAIIFYLIFVIGIFYFSIYPALSRESVIYAVVSGSIFGFITYSTYDLTNLATLKGWPVAIVFIDIAWGTVLSAIVSIAGYCITKLIN